LTLRRRGYIQGLTQGLKRLRVSVDGSQLRLTGAVNSAAVTPLDHEARTLCLTRM